MSPPHDFGPPYSNTTNNSNPPSKEVFAIPHLHVTSHLHVICLFHGQLKPCFFLYNALIQTWFTNKWEWILKIGKIFLFLTSSCTKTSLSFLTYIMVCEMRMKLCRHSFPHFPVFSQCFQMQFLSRWKCIFNNGKMVLFITSLITKMSLTFITYIMVLDIKRDYMTLCFRILGWKSSKIVSDLDVTSSNKSCNQIRIAFLHQHKSSRIVPKLLK